VLHFNDHDTRKNPIFHLRWTLQDYIPPLEFFSKELSPLNSSNIRITIHQFHEETH